MRPEKTPSSIGCLELEVSSLKGFLRYLRGKFIFEASREESLDLRHQNLKFCFRGILGGTFNFEAFREVISLWRHLGMDEGRYDIRALVQFPSYPKGEQRPPKAALKRVHKNLVRFRKD